MCNTDLNSTCQDNEGAMSDIFQLLLKAEMLLHLPHFEEADPLQVAPELGWLEGRCGTQKLLREASQVWATGRKSSNIAGEILPCDACDAPRTVGTGE